MRSWFLSFALAACGSVPVHEPSYYRLALPTPASTRTKQLGTLRVGELALAADLAGDRLLVQDGRVRVLPFERHRWAGPLDRLITDAVVAGLSRSGAFARVKGAFDDGGEDLLLQGRVLECHQVAIGGAWHGRVTLDLALQDTSGRLWFQGELSGAQRLAGDDPEALVVALSAALAEVVDRILASAGAALAARPAR
jgi:hypothetical protein